MNDVLRTGGKWALAVMIGAAIALYLAEGAAPAAEAEADELAVVWTSGDPDVAHRMALMYTHAAKTQGWFDEVTLIVWGPSQRLVAADGEVREKVLDMQADGITVQACIVCAESYGLTETLRDHGLEVKAMGAPLTGFVKDSAHVLTF